MTTRRNFLQATPAAFLAARALAAKNGLTLGVASYSFRKFSREKAIEMIKACNAPYVSVKSFHLDYKATPEEFTLARKQFKDAGLTILSGGNIDLKGSEAEIRAMFEYAKAAGFPMIVCAPSAATMPTVEKMVKEYNIRAAVHNHGPEDKHFPTPQSILDVIKNMDPRMGLCTDVGHTARTGVDVVKTLAESGPRLFDIHIKDLKNLSDKDSQCAVGEGAMPVREIFAQLKKMKYKGAVMLEYEINADNPLPGMQKSFEHMRQVLATQKS